MKKTSLIIGMMLILVSTLANAQSKTGFDYFNGKWNAVVNGPYGDVKMVIGFEKNADKIISTLKDPQGNELYKVNKTTIGDIQATINFEGSQGPVDMVINKKDDDHITGDIMGGVATVSGERVKTKN